MTTAEHPLTPPDPGSKGEHILQERYGSQDRADRFYREQMLDTLTRRMIEFLGQQTWFLLSTADHEGHPAGSPRWGEPGFVAVLDDRTIAWPELRGNGVMTSLGNLVTNPWAHLTFLDLDQRIGLHLTGQTVIVEADTMAVEYPEITSRPVSGKRPDRWVVLSLELDYIHCRKHFPRTDAPVEWGTDDVKAKGGDFFAAKDTPSTWAPDKGPVLAPVGEHETAEPAESTRPSRRTLPRPKTVRVPRRHRGRSQ